MCWWFKTRRSIVQFLRYESREIATDAYEFAVRMPDGTERVERFADPVVLAAREVGLQHPLTDNGWMGPCGWNI